MSSQNLFIRVPAFRVELEFGNVGFWGEGTIGVPGEKLLGARREPTTNSTHIWRQFLESNPGHTGGRRALSPLRHPSSPPPRSRRFFYPLDLLLRTACKTGFASYYKTIRLLRACFCPPSMSNTHHLFESWYSKFKWCNSYESNELDNSYDSYELHHLNLQFHVLNKWWVLDSLCFRCAKSLVCGVNRLPRMVPLSTSELFMKPSKMLGITLLSAEVFSRTPNAESVRILRCPL